MDLGSIRIPIKNKNLHGPEWVLADEISSYFGEKKSFAVYLGIIRRLGMARARKNFVDAKEAKEPKKLFMFLSKKV